MDGYRCHMLQYRRGRGKCKAKAFDHKSFLSCGRAAGAETRLHIENRAVRKSVNAKLLAALNVCVPSVAAGTLEV